MLIGGLLLSENELRAKYAGGASIEPSVETDTDAVRHFDDQVAPILARHCLECHDSATKKGKLDLSRKDPALAGGSTGPAIVPGKADESLLWEYVEFDDMPPDGRPSLSDEEKEHLRRWIDGGAVWLGDTIDPLAHMRDNRAASNWVLRLTVPEYIETVRSAVGVEIEQETRRILPPDLRADGFSNTAYNLGIDLKHVEAYAELAEIIVGKMDVMAFAAEFAPCRELNDDCMRQVISGMGQWLLRGPLEANEVDSFLSISKAVAEEGGNFAEAVGYIIEAMLQSPRFIYRIETQKGDGSAQTVSDFELASRMSYILWGGPPDKELLRAAEAGELSDRRRVEVQVQRMLKDPRAIERSSRFIHEWLDLDRLSNLRPNSERFPNWNEQLAADMREETLAFFREIAWEQNRPLADLMNAQVTYATPRLAEFYNLDPAFASERVGQVLAAVATPAQREDAPQRVSGGLQVLYTFEEGNGDTVRDVSGQGEPIHLKIEDTSAVRWGGDGLAVRSSTLIRSDKAPKRLIDAVKKSRAITLEAWITPAERSQAGPARIVTLSSGSNQRNFTLGQEGDRYQTRLRTQRTDANGLPGVDSSSQRVETRLTHVVYTREANGKARLYVDGQEKGSRDVGGDLSNWDGNFRLMLGNESSKDRLWKGTLHLVAIYDRALSGQDVRKNQSAGLRSGSGAPPALASAPTSSGRRSRDGLEALYTFEEGQGDIVRDVSGQGEPIHLKIEDASAVRWNRDGLDIRSSTLIASEKVPRRLIDTVKKSRAVTLEAWITSADTSQAGPARILTLSSGSSQRNFTIGQEKDRYDIRFRTTTKDANGLPNLASPARAVEPRLTHVVYTRNQAGTGILYIDGQERSTHIADGTLDNWDNGFRLMLTNESSKDRPWKGTLHRVAIYSRALSIEEIQKTGEDDRHLRFDLASLPARGGLLTQGSVLTVGGDEASMVARGLFVLHDLLYSAVGNPPPCVDTNPVPTKPGMSQRGVAEVRLADASCSGCHSKFEPLAFGLEKFDGIGAYHEVDEHGNKLREDGEILFPGQDKPISYKTSSELMDLLAGSDRVRMNMTRKVTQFALGRPLVRADEPILESIHQSAQQGGGTYSSLISAIVMSDLVRKTRTETDR
ncbi:hypothetical protein BH23PLA1_BH23PLA1_21030 [soil metagenome]